MFVEIVLIVLVVSYIILQIATFDMVFYKIKRLERRYSEVSHEDDVTREIMFSRTTIDNGENSFMLKEVVQALLDSHYWEIKPIDKKFKIITKGEIK
jgi:hypothetical protein